MIVQVKAQPDEGSKELQTALFDKPNEAARSLGHIEYKEYADDLTDQLAAAGETRDAVKLQGQLYDVLAARKCAAPVLAQVDAKRETYKARRK